MPQTAYRVGSAGGEGGGVTWYYEPTTESESLCLCQRLDTLKRFKEDQLDVLLATDVAARGLDIRGVKTFINYTMPTTLEHYIHRVGRTARAGRAGRSVSIAGEGERKMVREIVRGPGIRLSPELLIMRWWINIGESWESWRRMFPRCWRRKRLTEISYFVFDEIYKL